MSTLVTVETRRKYATGGRTRITVTEAVVPEQRLLDLILQTPIGTSRDCRWPDGRLESFYWTRGLQLAGPSNSRLLPKRYQREHGHWYVESRRVYWQGDDGLLGSVAVPRG
jgi:hypothetical protein